MRTGLWSFRVMYISGTELPKYITLVHKTIAHNSEQPPAIKLNFNFVLSSSIHLYLISDLSSGKTLSRHLHHTVSLIYLLIIYPQFHFEALWGYFFLKCGLICGTLFWPPTIVFITFYTHKVVTELTIGIF